MPEPGSKLINAWDESDTEVRNRWNDIPSFQAARYDIDRSRLEGSNYRVNKLQYRDRPFRLPFLPENGRIALPEDIRLTTQECYEFTWKSCAIYCTVDPDILGVRPTMLDFHHAIYRCWFKGDAINVRMGNFFAKCIGCWQDPPPSKGPEQTNPTPRHLLTTDPDIPALIATHRALCSHIKHNLASPDPSERDDPSHANFILNPLFEKVIVVMDRVNWDWEGLDIVLSDQARPLRLDCNNFDIPQPAFREGDQGQLFRARVEDVVRLVESMRIREDEGRMWGGLVGKE